MKQGVIIVLLLGFCLPVFSSQNQIDSLEKVLENKPVDTSYVKTLLVLAEQYYSFVGADKCYETSEKAKDLAQALNYSCGIGDALNNMGTINGSYYGDFNSGLNLLNKAWIAVANADCNETRASILNNRGYLYQSIGDIEKALNDYLLSYEIRKKDNNEYGQALSLNQIGYLYGLQNMQEKAIETYEEALVIMEKLNDTYQQGILLNNIGAAYDNIGQEEKALDYLNKCLSLRIEMNDSLGLGYVYNNIAAIYREQNIIALAYEYFMKSLDVRLKIKQVSGIVYSQINLAKTALLDQDVQKAMTYLNDAEKRAKNAKLRPLLKTIYQLKSEGHGLLNEYQPALTYAKLEQSLNDSLFNESKSKEIGKLEAKFEFEKQQEQEQRVQEEQLAKEKIQTQRRNNLQYSGIFLVVLLLFAFVFMSGRFSLNEKVAEGLIFFTFLLFFEFLLVLLDPVIENWSNGAPAYKLILNALLAALIFPLHAFFENTIKKRIL